MLSKYLVSAAALAASALAAPLDSRALVVDNVVIPVTMTVTAGHIPPQATPAPSSGGGFLESPEPSSTSSDNPEVSEVVVPSSSSPSSSSSSSGSASLSGSMIDVINYWREQYGLNDLEWDDELASQAASVGQSNGGVRENHQLISGMNMGQVIAPGQANPVPSNQEGLTPFAVTYAAWLCEVSTDSQLSSGSNNGVSMCSLANSILHIEYDGDTGHHDIIVGSGWTKAGCAYTADPSSNQDTSTYQGLYVCNYSS